MKTHPNCRYAPVLQGDEIDLIAQKPANIGNPPNIFIIASVALVA